MSRKPGPPGSLQDHCSHHQAAFLSSPPAVLSFVAPAPHPARLLPLSVGCDTGSKGRDSPDYGGLPGPAPHASAPSTAPWAGLACRSLQKAEQQEARGSWTLGCTLLQVPAPRRPHALRARQQGQVPQRGPALVPFWPQLSPATCGRHLHRTARPKPDLKELTVQKKRPTPSHRVPGGGGEARWGLARGVGEESDTPASLRGLGR